MLRIVGLALVLLVGSLPAVAVANWEAAGPDSSEYSAVWSSLAHHDWTSGDRVLSTGVVHNTTEAYAYHSIGMEMKAGGTETNPNLACNGQLDQAGTPGSWVSLAWTDAQSLPTLQVSLCFGTARISSTCQGTAGISHEGNSYVGEFSAEIKAGEWSLDGVTSMGAPVSNDGTIGSLPASLSDWVRVPDAGLSDSMPHAGATSSSGDIPFVMDLGASLGTITFARAELDCAYDLTISAGTAAQTPRSQVNGTYGGAAKYGGIAVIQIDLDG